MTRETKNSTIYSTGFIKVLKCYESVLNAYKARCEKSGIEPNSKGDDIFKSQMMACRNLHSNWAQTCRPHTDYDIGMINGLSLVLCELVVEKLEDMCK